MAKTTGDRGYYLLGMKILIDFGASIAVPVVVLTWLGQRLDARWGTKPLFLILGFVFAAAFSASYIYRKAREYGRQYQRLINEQSKVKDNKELDSRLRGNDNR